MHQQKHSSLYTWTTLLKVVPRWAVGLLEIPHAAPFPAPGAPHGAPSFSSSLGLSPPVGSGTQGLAQDPGVDRKLTGGGERTKTQDAKRTRRKLEQANRKLRSKVTPGQKTKGKTEPAEDTDSPSQGRG